MAKLIALLTFCLCLLACSGGDLTSNINPGGGDSTGKGGTPGKSDTLRGYGLGRECLALAAGCGYDFGVDVMRVGLLGKEKRKGDSVYFDSSDTFLIALRHTDWGTNLDKAVFLDAFGFSGTPASVIRVPLSENRQYVRYAFNIGWDGSKAAIPVLTITAACLAWNQLWEVKVPCLPVIMPK